MRPVIGGLLAALQDLVHHHVALHGIAERLAHPHVLQRLGAFLADVQQIGIGAGIGNRDRLVGKLLLEPRILPGGDLHPVQLARLIAGQRDVVVVHRQALDPLHHDIGGVPVFRVLLHADLHAQVVAFQHIAPLPTSLPGWVQLSPSASTTFWLTGKVEPCVTILGK